nr:hypothetical protein JVH1_5527 [Rhodococcus sp. JVH1]
MCRAHGFLALLPAGFAGWGTNRMTVCHVTGLDTFGHAFSISRHRFRREES